MEMKLCAPILRMPAWAMRFRISACASFYYRFRLTLATARRLAVQEFGTAKGLEPDYEVDLSNCTLYMNGGPIAWRQGELSEITMSEEVQEPRNGLPCKYMECTLYFKRWTAFAGHRQRHQPQQPE